jgi:hypothetical protein
VIEEKERNNRSKPPWLVDVLVAIGILIVLLSVVAFLYGKDIIERPVLALFILLAWLGALVGIKIPDSTGS